MSHARIFPPLAEENIHAVLLRVRKKWKSKKKRITKEEKNQEEKKRRNRK